MNRIIALGYFLLLASIVLSGCSELEDGITSSGRPKIHGEGVLDKNSPNFHGRYFDKLNFRDCQNCHAKYFQGGLTPVNCGSANCHPSILIHVDSTGINDITSPNFHGKFIAASNWNLQNCTQCHGANYGGGSASPTCLTCHNQPNGPEACNTCHGVFNDPAKIASEEGSHFAHLYDNQLGKNVECNQCHTVPQAFSSVGHIDGIPGAELIFGDLAKLKTNSQGAFSHDPTLPVFVPNPSFNTSTGSCSNVYCHGYFKNGNIDNVAKFNDTEVKCGSCHGNSTTGDPMPKTFAQGGTHPVLQTQNCTPCHGDVVSVSGTTYTIIDKQKHINGKLNIFGLEKNY